MKEWTWTVGKGEFIGSVTLLQAEADDAQRLRRGNYPVGFVSDLEVHPERRGQGWARTLLSSLVSHADKNHIDLWTYVSPFGTQLFPGLDVPQLVKLYEGYGLDLLLRPEYENEMVRRWRA